jgi:hypothetical protein
VYVSMVACNKRRFGWHAIMISSYLGLLRGILVNKAHAAYASVKSPSPAKEKAKPGVIGLYRPLKYIRSRTKKAAKFLNT